ncbi:unnamed protein product [Orchesella dallaii]|uniref:G-protein coupled receptors family 1 profile domain-containing protein n=1 Tax=Orchesella dallaii TaxID=48710 RepID=A0ABP1R1K3_9HEXA
MTMVAEHIVPKTTPLTSWKEDDTRGYLENNRTSAVTSVLDKVRFTLEVIFDDTKTIQSGPYSGASAYISTSTSATIDVDISSIMSSSLTENNMTNVSTALTTASTTSSNAQSTFPGRNVIIPLYTLIFILSFVGNLMVILTLARNRRMRTVTNVLLLNLAISDLLLGVFCMPVTLIGQLLRNFIFGAAMCRILPYFQEMNENEEHVRTSEELDVSCGETRKGRTKPYIYSVQENLAILREEVFQGLEINP